MLRYGAPYKMSGSCAGVLARASGRAGTARSEDRAEIGVLASVGSGLGADVGDLHGVGLEPGWATTKEHASGKAWGCSVRSSPSESVVPRSFCSPPGQLSAMCAPSAGLRPVASRAAPDERESTRAVITELRSWAQAKPSARTGSAR